MPQIIEKAANSYCGAALAAAACCALILLPIVLVQRFDFSVFILAGDHFVRASSVEFPISISPHSLGYDGQFFYRLALHPLSTKQSAYGIAFDDPAKRAARIIYPLLAKIFTLGSNGMIPEALVFTNVLGLLVVATSCMGVRLRWDLAWWFPFAVILWPGYWVAITHDTAEIAASALMLVALCLYISGRLWGYCGVAILAALTRETTLVLFFGVSIYEVSSAFKRPSGESARRFAIAILPLFMFLAWWVLIGLEWGGLPQSISRNQDVGWPLLGWAFRIVVAINGLAALPPDVGNRLLLLWLACLLIAFCVAVASGVRHAVADPETSAVAIGWILSAVLMSLLTAKGPWVEALSLSRAFTECWVLGCLLLSHPKRRGRALGDRRMALPIAAVLLLGADAAIYRWSFLLILATRN